VYHCAKNWPYNWPVGISLHPERLKRYTDIARLLFKYGRSDLVARAGLEEALGAQDVSSASNAPPPEELAADLERLGPAYIKLGQLLSTRSDLLPAPYLEALGRLQDSVAPFSFADVERVISEELGLRISKGFATFDAEPLAAASLGQVHRATLRDGRDVAVKIQRPDIREGLALDLATMQDIAEFLDKHTDAGRQFDFVQMVSEFRRTLAQELDYRREAQNLLRLADNLAPFKRIVVPRPVDNYTSARVITMEFIQGRKITALTPIVLQEIDGEGLAHELFRAYLHQIIIDGFFHADPHPGNVFLTDDGRIALLDLGMVSHLAPSRQDQLLKLLLAIGDGNGDAAATLALQIGDERPELDEPALRRDIQNLVSSYQNVALEELQVGRVVMEISRSAGQHGLRLPPELTMLGKTLLNLDQVGRALAPGFDVNKALRDEGAELMQQRMRKSMSPSNLFTAALEAKEFVEQLPGRVNKVLDVVTNNQLRLSVDIVDKGELIEGLQKIANRITLGLLLASLIIGAAMLFFLAAAGGGLWLAFNILSSDRSATPRR